MILADDERRMLDGQEGPAVQAAMELLVRYGEVLGAERLIDTDNVCGANIFNAQQRKLAGGTLDDVFAQISLDSPGGFEIPRVRAHSCQLIGPMDTLEWQVQGVPEETRDAILDSESYSARHGIHLMNTCTPYQVGQRADAGRALRLDGVIRRHLRQLGARRDDQRRGQGERGRGHAHREDPVLGVPPAWRTGTPLCTSR